MWIDGGCTNQKKVESPKFSFQIETITKDEAIEFALAHIESAQRWLGLVGYYHARPSIENEVDGFEKS